MDKFLFIDFETTGLPEHGETQIIQAGMVYSQYSGRDLSLNINARPDDHIQISPQALKVIGKTEDELRSYENDQKSLYLKLSKFFSQLVNKYKKEDKMYFVGYNSQYDWGMLHSLWKAQKDMYLMSYFWWPYIDVAQMVGFDKLCDPASPAHQLANMKLSTVAGAYGIELEDAHDALADIVATKKLFEVLRAKYQRP